MPNNSEFEDMKKILVLIFCLCTLFAVSAQQIDKQEEDGSRWIISNGENLYSTWSTGAGFDLRLNVFPNGDKFWRFCVTTNEGKGTIEKGRVILIKFEDGSVMELKNCNEIGPADYQYQVTKYGTNYYLNPQYPITEEELHKLLTDKVTKVRIEHDAGHFDREINSKKFNKRINTLYKQVKDRLSVSNDVHDGF